MFIRCSLQLATAFSSSNDSWLLFSLSLTHSVVIMLNESFIAVVVHFTPLDIGMNSSKKKLLFSSENGKLFYVNCSRFSRQRKRSAIRIKKNFFLTSLLLYLCFAVWCVQMNKKKELWNCLGFFSLQLLAFGYKILWKFTFFVFFHLDSFCFYFSLFINATFNIRMIKQKNEKFFSFKNSQIYHSPRLKTLIPLSVLCFLIPIPILHASSGLIYDMRECAIRNLCSWTTHSTLKKRAKELGER